MPVILARRRREVRRNGGELRAFERQDPVELGEAHVVTHGQPELPALGLRDNGVLARLLRFGLAIQDAADLDVEQMDLAVRRDDLAVRVEHEAGVRPLVATLAQLDIAVTDSPPLIGSAVSW